MGKPPDCQPHAPKNAAISDVAELIVKATGDESDCLNNPSTIALADLFTIKRALDAALSQNRAENSKL